jgi:hypothetical protein
MMAPAPPIVRELLLRQGRLWLRLVVAVPLGYGLTVATVIVLSAVANRLGMARGDAVVVMSMLGFVIYLVWVLWAFAEPSLIRLYSVLTLGVGVSWAVTMTLRLGV